MQKFIIVLIFSRKTIVFLSWQNTMNNKKSLIDYSHFFQG